MIRYGANQREDGGRAAAPRRLMLALAALLALLVQGFAGQTHLHRAATPARVAVARLGHHPGHAAVDCAGCRLLAEGGTLLMPGAASLGAATRSAAPVLSGRRAAPPAARRPPAWRSRGPPPAFSPHPS